MDSQFLEFLGNYLLNVAQGQRQIEQISSWISQGFSGTPDLTDMFGRFYKLHPAYPSSSEDDSDRWQKAIADFQTSLAQYARVWGWVSQADYQNLQRKCEMLETTVEDQRQIIQQLQVLLETAGLGNGELAQQFRSLILDQTNQFQELMKCIGQSFQKNDSSR